MRIYKFKTSHSLPPYLVFDGKDGMVDITLKREDGSLDVSSVDEFSGQPFMLNENGFIMSDIQVFEEAASDSVARAALHRLQVLHPDNAPIGTPVSDLMRQIVPFNFSTPAEYLKIQEAFAKDWYARQVAAKEKEQNIQFDNNDVSQSDGESKSV